VCGAGHDAPHQVLRRRTCGPTSCCGAAGKLFTHRFRIFATLRLLLVDSHILELLPLWSDVTFGSDSDTLFDTQVFFLLIGCDPNGWLMVLLLVLVPAFKGCLSQVVFLARFTKRQPS